MTADCPRTGGQVLALLALASVLAGCADDPVASPAPNGGLPDAPDLVHTVPGAEFGGQFTNNLHKVGQHLYVATGNFMGFPQQPPGLAIVDVSEPGSAFVAGTWTHDSGARGAHVVEVHGDRAFLGASFEGLIILNVSDPEGIEFVSQYIPDIDFPRVNPPPLQVPAARGLTVADPQTLLLAYDAGGLRVIDIGNPAAPVEVGRYINAAIDPTVQALA